MTRDALDYLVDFFGLATFLAVVFLPAGDATLAGADAAGAGADAAGAAAVFLDFLAAGCSYLSASSSAEAGTGCELAKPASGENAEKEWIYEGTWNNRLHSRMNVIRSKDITSARVADTSCLGSNLLQQVVGQAVNNPDSLRIE
jgi:hypothetical protein